VCWRIKNMAGSTSLGVDRVVKEDGLYTQLTDEV